MFAKKSTKIEAKVVMTLMCLFFWYLLREGISQGVPTMEELRDVSGELVYVSNNFKTGKGTIVIRTQKGKESFDYSFPKPTSDYLKELYGKHVTALAETREFNETDNPLKSNPLYHLEIEGRNYINTQEMLEKQKSTRPALKILSQIFLALSIFLCISTLKTIFRSKS